MKFCVVGINHHIAPIDIRERVHFKETDIIEATDILLSESIEELVILSTCNRSEIYFLTYNMDSDMKKVKKFYEEFFDISDLDSYVIEKYSDDALEHLFNVTVGLDSLVIGEDQILGQVRDAHMTSMDIGASKKDMNKIFREAITLAKQIKTETDISDQPISISYIGVKKIDEVLGLKGKKAMIIGLGNMGRLALNHLIELDTQIYVTNRTLENSLKVQREFENEDIEVIPFEDMNSMISEMDVLISATSSPHVIITKENIHKRNKPLYIMDLSLPRDISPEVAEIEDVVLYDIDSLQSLSEKSLNEKKRILDSYRDEIKKKVMELQNWSLNSKVDPIMKNLNERCDKIADDTLNYIFRKTDMNHSEQLKVEKIVRSALKKVLREPLLSIKEIGDNAKKETVIKILDEVLNKWDIYQ